MKPLVSIIVPLYNCERYIGKCINSLLRQSYGHIEIIVVNDGSTDGSDKILQQLVSRDARIRYICQSNHGVAHARNTALKMAIGEYILFVDADDYVDAEYVKGMVDCAERNHSDLVISGFTMEAENGRKIKVLSPDKYERFQNEVWAYRLSACCGRMYRKAFWDRYHLKFIQEQNARAEDVPIVLFANAMARNIAVISRAEYHYVQRTGSAMHNREKKVPFLFPYTAFKIMYEKVMESGPYNSRMFWDIGILKFLAQFEFVIYRNADRREKRRFHTYVYKLLGEDIVAMRHEWKKLKHNIGLPMLHKIAISLFVKQLVCKF